MAKRESSAPILADVAREAHVSLKTASRVLNGSPNVRKEKVARVQAAMARIGYRPNEVARSLMTRKSSAIGIVVANLSNPFIVKAIKEIQEIARSNGYVVIVTSSGGSPDVERSEIETLVRRQIEGLIIAPANTRRNTLSNVLPSGLPVVTFDQSIRGANFDSVVITNRSSAHEATEHLLGHGLRKVVAIGTKPNTYTTEERVAGYREAMNSAKMEPTEFLVKDETFLATEWLEKEIFRGHKPDALFLLNWITTLHVLGGMRELGIRSGQDMPFIAFDDFDLGDVLSPRLSVVQQPSALLGRESAKLLFERLSGEVERNRRKVRLRASLLIRESCGCR